MPEQAYIDAAKKYRPNNNLMPRATQNLIFMIIDKLMIETDRLKIAGMTPRISAASKTWDMSDMGELSFSNCFCQLIFSQNNTAYPPFSSRFYNPHNQPKIAHNRNRKTPKSLHKGKLSDLEFKRHT